MGYSNATKAILFHVDADDKFKVNELGNPISGPLTLSNNEQNAIYTNESGLYSLILKSEKPEANGKM